MTRPAVERRAERTPGAWALRDPGTSYTWAELSTAVAAASSALAGLDLGPHSRIAVMARNSATTALAYAAALYAGVSVTPVSFHLTAREVAYLLTDGRAGALLADAHCANVAAQACQDAGVEQLYVWGGTPHGARRWEDLLAASAEPPDLERTPRPNLLYTSGTTGFPKGVETPARLPATVGERLAELAAAAGHGPFLTVGPLYHTGPLGSIRELVGGRPLFVLPHFDAEAVLATIQDQRITGTLMVPAHFTKLLALPSDVRRRYDVSSLEVVVHTGSACPASVKRAMIEWWGPVLVEKYGGTESGTLCSITSAEWLEHPGSVGRAVPPFEALAVGDDDQELPRGQDGRLYFRDTTGAGIAFFGAPDKTAQAHLAANVFTVGDSGHVDADGYVYITGRHADMVVSGGVNLYPAEAENVLRAHPLVADVAVIGVPDAVMGERLHGLVVRSGPPVSEQDLLSFCREGLAHPKCPRSLEFVDELPRTPMGKLDKKALSAPYWASPASGTV